MEHIGRAVARAHGAGADAEAVPIGRIVEPRRRGGEVVLAAQSPALPQLSRALQGWVTRAALPPRAPVSDETPREVDGGIVAVPARMPPTPATTGEKAEAREPIERLRRILSALAHEATIEAWLRRATGAVVAGKVPAGDELQRWVAAVVLALRGRPDACFTAESVAIAVARWKWWPSGAEVVAVCDEVEARYRDMLRGLEDVERAPLATGPGRERLPDPVAEKSPEEVAAVRAAAAAFTAEVQSREVAERARRPLSVAARPVPPDALIALCEAQAKTASTPEVAARLLSRARRLRQQHGIAVSEGVS